MLLLLEAQEGNWDEIDLMVRAFQGATSALRYADVPVVVAPAGLALGGGCEVVLHGDRVGGRGNYMGLVEVGVGLICWRRNEGNARAGCRARAGWCRPPAVAAVFEISDSPKSRPADPMPSASAICATSTASR
jgi:hypothetical protein